VSSITDNGTGDYTVNFTTAMPDADYSPAGLAGRGTTAGAELFIQTPTNGYLTSSLKLFTVTGAGAATDGAYVSVAIFR
jgi:hypothetical protein